MNNLFISTTFMKDGASLQEALKKCNKVKIQSVEIGSNHCYEENYNYLVKCSFQYLVHNYFPIPKDSFIINIASFDNNIRTKSIFHIKGAIDFCKTIGAKLYTFHPGFLSDPISSNNSQNNYDFHWGDNQLYNSDTVRAKALMYSALDEIITYAKSINIRIAIETEGSFNKKEYLLMQRPQEYEEFMKKYSSTEIGINLNIGHLNLAANAFNFKRLKFVDLIQDYIVAMELSHNNGVEDQHMPLKVDGWYWDLINDLRFKNVYKILEFRNTPVNEITKNIDLIKEKTCAISIS